MAEQVKKSLVRAVDDLEKFDEFLQSAGDKLVVVDFYAEWCGPCKMIAPEVEAMAKDLIDTVIFLKVNVDDCDEIATQQKVQAMPTFKFFRNGEQVGEFVGANAGKLREAISRNTNEQVKS